MGGFSLAVPPGTYTIQASHQGYLVAVKEGVGVQVGETTNVPMLTLTGGDVNGDGRINIFDLVLIGKNYGKAGPVDW